MTDEWLWDGPSDEDAPEVAETAKPKSLSCYELAMLLRDRSDREERHWR